MGPQFEAAIEPDQEVLALGLDGADACAQEPMDLRDGTGALRTGGGHDPSHEMWPQPCGGPEERVAFRHSELERVAAQTTRGEARAAGAANRPTS